ncbi:secretion protein HlyD [Flavobacterium akiainvivens]|uniref:Secretion protein HlyD n=1 Tax=Flavobacterium akiainvivens TaxID=1202724 RepID=A0A0M8MJH1_9FLAO|nr:HlyD family secretion protein [Flavobacterium akiainvivens]KOS07481.1 secretion protein HlyD [Flavobacterium akiainvivens]SFQ63465.1 membrane fusion protein, multidrug efflux system [Flavobacterium akiainvivens]
MKLFSPATSKGYLHTVVTVVSMVMVVSGIVLATWFFVYYRNHEETNDAQVEQYITPVAARISGYIKEVRFQENQFVHKGDTLIVIDNREYKARLDKAVADELTAKSAINVSRHAAVATAGQDVVEQSKLPGAKAVMVKAQQELERYNALYKEQAATLQQVERVQADYDAALSHYNEIKNSITRAGLDTRQAGTKIPEAEAVYMAKKAEAENAALFYSYTVITAPYDGYVGKRTLQPGQLVKEGQTLVNVVSSEKWVVANFKETQLEYLKVGSEVTLAVDALGDREFTGIIQSLSPASGARFSVLPPDNATGNFVKIEQRIPVKIVLKEDEGAEFLRAGMNVIVIAEHR